MALKITGKDIEINKKDTVNFTISTANGDVHAEAGDTVIVLVKPTIADASETIRKEITVSSMDEISIAMSSTDTDVEKGTYCWGAKLYKNVGGAEYTIIPDSDDVSDIPSFKVVEGIVDA